MPAAKYATLDYFTTHTNQRSKLYNQPDDYRRNSTKCILNSLSVAKKSRFRWFYEAIFTRSNKGVYRLKYIRGMKKKLNSTNTQLSQKRHKI